MQTWMWKFLVSNETGWFSRYGDGGGRPGYWGLIPVRAMRFSFLDRAQTWSRGSLSLLSNLYNNNNNANTIIIIIVSGQAVSASLSGAYSELFPEAKAVEEWTWSLTCISDVVKNTWSYISTSQFFFMWCCLIKHIYNFIFTLNLTVEIITTNRI